VFCGYLPDKGSDRHQTEAGSLLSCRHGSAGQEMATKLPDMLWDYLWGGGIKVESVCISSDSDCRCSCDDTSRAIGVCGCEKQRV